jgi:hypothetical protein
MPIPGLYMHRNCILYKLDWQCIFCVSTHSTLMKSTRSINPYKIDAMRRQSKTTRLAYPIILLSLQKPRFLFSSILIMADVFSSRNSDLGKRIVLQRFNDDTASKPQVHVEIAVAHPKNQLQHHQQSSCMRPNKNKAKTILWAHLPWTASFGWIGLELDVTFVERSVVVEEWCKLLL